MFLSVNDVLGLPGIPNTPPGVRNLLNKRAGESSTLKRKRLGSKAFEYHIDCLPQSAQTALRARIATQTLNEPKETKETTPTTTARANSTLTLLRQCPALLDSKLGDLTDKQRSIADARCSVVAKVLQLEEHMSRIKAIRFVVQQARVGQLPAPLQQQVELANARKGAARTLGERSLNQWVLDYLRANDTAERLALLAPSHNLAKKPEQIQWLPLFLAHYRTPNGVSIQEAHRLFSANWQQLYHDQPACRLACPSIDAVRRALNKLPVVVKQRGRATGAAMTALQTYVKRDWSQMPVNGVWIGDGHSMKLKVAHPVHGRPFTPEITMVIDGCTRYLVGWSLSLSENTLAVADALRHSVQHNGVPLLYYSDNGAGETAKLLDAELTGILPRLGIEHPTGIPGNPQARGIIERLNKEIPARVARKFATYYGASADRDTVRITQRAIESAINAVDKNRPLNPLQEAALKKLPSWAQLIEAVEAEVNAYNQQHRHTELPKKLNGQHYTPAEYRAELLASAEIDYLSEMELRDMFRPQVLRVAQRGWLQLFNNDYFAEQLINVDGDEVRVEFDIHDATQVTVRSIEGAFICQAIWNGNKKAAFPVDYIDRVAEQRRQRRAGLNQRHAAEIEAERTGITLDNAPNFSLLLAEAAPVAEEEPYFIFASERDDYLKKQAKGTK